MGKDDQGRRRSPPEHVRREDGGEVWSGPALPCGQQGAPCRKKRASSRYLGKRRRFWQAGAGWASGSRLASWQGQPIGPSRGAWARHGSLPARGPGPKRWETAPKGWPGQMPWHGAAPPAGRGEGGGPGGKVTDGGRGFSGDTCASNSSGTSRPSPRRTSTATLGSRPPGRRRRSLRGEACGLPPLG